MKKFSIYFLFLFVAGCFGAVAPVKNASAQISPAPAATSAVTPAVTTTVVSPATDISNLIAKVPNNKPGVFYDLYSSKFCYYHSFVFANKWNTDFELGGADDKSAILLGASYDVANFKKLGVTLPVLNLIDVHIGGACGWQKVDVQGGQNDGKNKFIYGITASLITLSFN